MQEMLAAVKPHDNDLSTITTASTSQSSNTTGTAIKRFEEMFNILSQRLEKMETNQQSNRKPRKLRSPPRDHGSYCWTHRYLVVPSHTSAMCRNKKPGHKDNATREDNIGGSQIGKPTS